MRWDGHVCTYSEIRLNILILRPFRSFPFSGSEAFMQFAVILPECFKCHTLLFHFRKSGPDGKHTLLKGKCFTLVHLESWTPKLPPFTSACTRMQKTHTHTVNKIALHTLHRIQINTQSITCSRTGMFFCLLIFGINRQLEKAPLLGLYTCYSS